MDNLVHTFNEIKIFNTIPLGIENCGRYLTWCKLTVSWLNLQMQHGWGRCNYDGVFMYCSRVMLDFEKGLWQNSNEYLERYFDE